MFCFFRDSIPFSPQFPNEQQTKNPVGILAARIRHHLSNRLNATSNLHLLEKKRFLIDQYF
jgi:hypothetical protein